MLAQKLLQRTGVIDRLSVEGRDTYAHNAERLIEMEYAQLENDEPVSRIPLVWLALAETVGLEVDLDGRIVGGPRNEVQSVCVSTATLTAA